MACGALDSHPVKGPLTVQRLTIYEGVQMDVAGCRYCTVPVLVVESRAWLQFKSRKAVSHGR
jgi:hypothetical protein